MSDASNLDLVRCQAFGKIEASGVAFHVCAQGKDDFANGFLRKAAFQFADAEVLRFDAIDWGDAASENMEFAAVIACSFDADDVNRAFDDADDARVAPGIRADSAGTLFG